MLTHRPIAQVLTAFTKLQPDGSLLVPAEVVASRLRDIRILDVREPEEIEHVVGKIPGWVQTHFGSFGGAPKWPGHYDGCLLVCRDGARSGELSAWLSGQGHSCVALEGGLLRWAQLGYRMEKAEVDQLRWGRNELFSVFLSMSRARPFQAAAVFRAVADSLEIPYASPSGSDLRRLRSTVLDGALRAGTASARAQAWLRDFDEVIKPGPQARPTMPPPSSTAPGTPVSRDRSR